VGPGAGLDAVPMRRFNYAYHIQHEVNCKQDIRERIFLDPMQLQI